MTSFATLYQLDSLAVAFLLVPALVQATLYGVYATLFCQCMYIFRKRPTNGRRALLIGTILLFILCTAQYAMNSCVTVFNLGLGNLIYVSTNLVADSMFTYRCYVIWGRKWVIILLPILLIAIGTGVGALTSVYSFGPLGKDSVLPYDPRLVFFINLATNVTLTILSAGRIWWISREIRKALGPKISKKYNTTISLIVESGSIYCAAIIAYLISIRKEQSVLFDINGSDIASYTLFGVLTQIVGIVPTLIVVRMGLGISVEDVQTIMASQIQFEQDGGDPCDYNTPKRPGLRQSEVLSVI